MQVPSHGRDLLLWKEGQGLPVEKSLVEKCLSTNTNSTSVIYGKNCYDYDLKMDCAIKN